MTDADRDALVDKVYRILPKRDCGLCGYGTCRRFARAIVAGKAPLSGCRQDPDAARRIAEVLGVSAPSATSHAEPAARQKEAAVTITTKSLRREINSTMKEADAVLARIATLEQRRRRAR